tara:strand:+ start:573 stop:1118 length:546 start_codon:yes stop_codon:yes gene_type:complete
MLGTIEAKGSCLCGSVEIQASSMSLDVGACHCSVFRKWEGGLFYKLKINGQYIVVFINVRFIVKRTQSMQQVSVINTITVPQGMEKIAEQVRAEYVAYFKEQEGFVSSTFYKSIHRENDDAIKYINTVVWQSYAHFERVVNLGFNNDSGENNDGKKVLGKGFPDPIKVSPGQYVVLAQTTA